MNSSGHKDSEVTFLCESFSGGSLSLNWKSKHTRVPGCLCGNSGGGPAGAVSDENSISPARGQMGESVWLSHSQLAQHLSGVAGLAEPTALGAVRGLESKSPDALAGLSSRGQCFPPEGARPPRPEGCSVQTGLGASGERDPGPLTLLSLHVWEQECR